MSFFWYFVSVQKRIWCHILSILSVFKWKLIDPLWVFCRHWKESCGFHCFPSVQNGRRFSLLLTQRYHHTCTFWAMLGMYASKYGLLVALIFNPFCFCLLLVFLSEVGIYSFPLDIQVLWNYDSERWSQHVYCCSYEYVQRNFDLDPIQFCPFLQT